MSFGYAGKIGLVDLSGQSVRVDDLDQESIEIFLKAKAVAALNT